MRGVNDAHRSEWFEKAAKAGIAAKGAVYLVMGLLSASAAIGSGSKPEGSRGALESLASHTGGSILLVLLGVGLAAYALYRFVEAAKNPSFRADGAKGILKRIGAVLSGLIHVGLAIAAFDLLLGKGTQDDAANTQGLTAKLMDQPFGPVLVGIAGGIIVAVGIRELVKAWRADLEQDLAISRMRARTRELAVMAGRAGSAARGIVFGIVGALAIGAAASSNPGKSRGVEGALETLQRMPAGPWLLGAVAIGLMGYAGWCVIRARYLRVRGA